MHVEYMGPIALRNYIKVSSLALTLYQPTLYNDLCLYHLGICSSWHTRFSASLPIFSRFVSGFQIFATQDKAKPDTENNLARVKFTAVQMTKLSLN
jgi:hypothetical protein